MAVTRTGKWKAPFLLALAQTGNVTESAARVGTTRKTAQNHYRDDKAFAEGWGEALDEYYDGLEAVADQRARHGVEDLVLHEGAPVFVLVDARGNVRPHLIVPGRTAKVPRGHKLVALVRRKPSDALLIKLMAAGRPEKFRDRFQVTHDGKPDGPRTPAQREGEADAILAELREQLGVADAPAAPAG